MSIKAIWHCMFTPRLIKLYGNGPVEKLYEPSALESLGDRVLQSMYILWKLGVYTSPFLVGFLYRRGYFEPEGYVTLTKIATLIGGIIVVSYVIRGIGRMNNPMYQKFIKTLDDVTMDLSPSNKQQLANYDFEFYAWPVEFRFRDLPRDEVKSRLYVSSPQTNRTLLQTGMSLPCIILGYLAVHTFGIRLVYPGSIGLLQNVLAQGLLQGRSKLVEVNGGARYKLEAKDGNEVDIMFVDKRNTNNNGNTLVVCSEGNAGFYEIGIMGTPIAAGYSVLGWNHPGFGGSTGTPYPSQELNAMDVVMQFAIKKLGYKPENIVLFGWSIGGFSTSWAAMNYPNVKAVILDASFDDIMPLAINHMPSWSETIVRMAIRQHINLNIVEQLLKYPGPILLVRRLEDEVICTTMGEMSTNRGNYLLIKLLKYRYPALLEEQQQTVLYDYLGFSTSQQQEQYLSKFNINELVLNSYIENYFSENPKVYPLGLGQELSAEEKTCMVLFMARKYMRDFKAAHCTPLPSDMFQPPWDVSVDNDFVLT